MRVSSEKQPIAKSELIGRSVFARDGAYLGQVVAVGFRRGDLRRVGVQKEAGEQALRFFPAEGLRSEDARLVVDTLATRVPE